MNLLEEEGVEKETNEGNEIVKPFDPTLINIETKTPSLDTLIKRIERNSIQMDTSTYFQRKDDLWDLEKQSRLIESILIRFPLPAFFFDASDDNHWLIVDGLQRLSSIRNFVLKNYKLKNLEFLTQFNDFTFNELPINLRRVIEECQVVIYKIMPGTPIDVKFNIFRRINTGGLVLQAQEIRHALFQGKPAKFIQELAESKEFLDATNNSIKSNRMLDRDFANRFLCFYLFGVENYGKSDLDSFMSLALGAIYEKSDEEMGKIKCDFAKSMTLAKEIFGKNAFRKISHNFTNDRLNPINKALFDAISVQFSKLDEGEYQSLLNNKQKFTELFISSLNHNNTKNPFYESISSATGDKSRVSLRHKEILDIISKTIK
jgi:hypothetical protein